MKARPKLFAVIGAAAAHWVLGAIWFTVFQKPWLKGIGKTMVELSASGTPASLGYVVAFISNLAIAYVLGWLILATGPQTVGRGLQMAVLLWFGFVATTFATSYVFEARSFEIFAISAGYPLAGMLLMGSILGGWKAKAAQA